MRDLRTVYAGDEGVAEVVRGVSFEIRAGETLGLVGESGCGKSACALSLMRLLPASGRVVGGSVIVGDTDVLALNERGLRRVRGRRIGIVFQESLASLNPLLTVGHQLTESLRYHLGMGHREARVRALELLAEVGIADPGSRLGQFPHQLSGGLRQRVAVAIALAPNPDVLIADEPTTALDVTVQAQLLDLLRKEQRERRMALLLITHDLGVIASVTDRVAVMYAGRIVEEGSVAEIFAGPRHPYTAALLRSMPRLDRERRAVLETIAGQPPVLSALPARLSVSAPLRARRQALRGRRAPARAQRRVPGRLLGPARRESA